MRTLLLIAALVLGVLIGRCASERPAYVPPSVPTADSLPSAHWHAEVERLEGLLRERDGLVAELRARIRGLETRAPVVIERVDTVIDVREVPVIVGAVADRRGRLDLLRAGAADSTGMRRPEIARAIDLSRCDDGWALDGSRVVCDTPRLGHLTAVARLGLARDPAGIAVADGESPLGYNLSYREPAPARLQIVIPSAFPGCRTASGGVIRSREK